ncbi:ABC transporter ATP-binding protein [Thermoproteota archaeon]
MIKIKDLEICYGDFQALKNLNIAVKPNEFLCIIGPSGCGKTTVLNTIAGFIELNSGGMDFKGKVSTVFQDYNLFPWKTVAENIGFGPKMSKVKNQDKIVRRFLNLVGLEDFANHYPHELSGGMQQRVGIARALANNPEVLLMDEPFGSLDAQTRMRMQELLLSIWEKNKKTIVFVTHEIDEAIFLADRVVVLTKSPGKVKKEIFIDLDRPRKQDMIVSEEFVKIKKEILGLLDHG